MARPPDMRTMPVPRGQARASAPPMRGPVAGGATSNRGGTLAQVQQVMENAPPKIPTQVAKATSPAMSPPPRGPARMMKGGMYKGKPHSYAAGGKVTEGKY